MRYKLWLAAVLLAVISGCATDPAARPWWTLQETDFRGLQAGKTTKADVRARLGNPINAVVFPNQGEEVWDYRYPDGGYKMLAWVYFDTRGVYKHYVTQPDPAFMYGTDM